MSKKFALIGAGGYIAVRHMKAIKDVGGELVLAVDPSDSVGILDSFFPNTIFFTEFELFESKLYDLVQTGQLDYVVIASPNYLHCSHILASLRAGASVICEKPLVLNSADAFKIKSAELKYGKSVYTILQLRLHHSVVALRDRVQHDLKVDENKYYDVDLTYITSRGDWYLKSWKSDVTKSGGVAFNIGIHFFDMLEWVFGEVSNSKVYIYDGVSASGTLFFKNARVRWFLSVDYEMLPEEVKAAHKRTFRSIKIDSKEFEFSDGFTELHTQSYSSILNGQGFDVDAALSSIKSVEELKRQVLHEVCEDSHPFVLENCSND